MSPLGRQGWLPRQSGRSLRTLDGSESQRCSHTRVFSRSLSLARSSGLDVISPDHNQLGEVGGGDFEHLAKRALGRNDSGGDERAALYHELRQVEMLARNTQ